MNAAAKVIQQGSFFQGKRLKMHMSKQVFFQTVLVLLMLLSALAVVYTTNIMRMTCSQLEFAEQKTHQLQVQWGKLLLEQASLATPARVETLAKQQLYMVLPANKQAYLLRAE